MDKMRFFYDREGDVLDISIGGPKKAISEELEHDVIVRKDPDTKTIIGFTILNFERRFRKSKKAAELGLPINLKLIAAKA